MGETARARRNDERLAALARYDILDTPREDDFDSLARLAAEICGTPIGLITFAERDRQFFKAAVGFAGEASAPIDVGFCPQVVDDHAALIIPDTLAESLTPLTRRSSRTESAFTPAFRCSPPTTTCWAPCVCSTPRRIPTR